VDWQLKYEKEIQQAEEARRVGNEGKARVCARRAAGHAVGEYLRRNGFAPPGSSAYTRLQYLRSLREISPEAREAAHHLLLRITPDHNLPVETDLIAKARWLKENLIKD
jgi:HEPN domain-containing protein